MSTWNNNAVQFPHLLCEIMATQEIDLVSLADSMDLSVESVSEIFDRANTAWEEIKQSPQTMTGLQVSLDGGDRLK